MEIIKITKPIKRRRKPQPEASLKRAILTYLHLNGYVAFPLYTVGIPLGRTGKFIPVGTKGMADLYAILPGGIGCFIETKVRPRKQTPAQKEFQVLVEKGGNKYVLAYSLNDVIDVFTNREV